MALPIEQRLTIHEHDSALGRWTEVFAKPHAELASYVDAIWYGEGSTFYKKDRILPQGRAHLLMNLGPPQYLVRHPAGKQARAPFRDIWFSGAQTSYLDTEAPEGARLVGVAFRAHGAYPLLGFPQSETAGEVVELSALVGDGIASVRERIENAASTAERLDLLETWLLSRLPGPKRVHPVVPHLIDRIATTDGQLPMNEIVKETGFSRMHVSRLFLQAVGLTPKKLARVRRFHAALSRLEREPRVDWARLALETGYYDQSHLIRDFRAFAGSSPEEVLRAKKPDPFTLVAE